MIIVTGGAGFIGSHLVDRLLEGGEHVLVLDNLSSGRRELLERHTSNPNFGFTETDLTDYGGSVEHFRGADTVFHLAANPEVKREDTDIHFNQNILATYNVLKAMRKHGIRRIFFTSTSTVYGESKVIPTPEDYGESRPVSIYGASKLACEALISSYCHSFGMEAVVFRFANVIGARSRRGVTYDFVRKLRENPKELEILGDGRQNKSYIHIDDVMDGVFLSIEKAAKPFDVFNIGSEDSIPVNMIAEIISGEMGLAPKIKHTGGRRGWKGDVPEMRLDISKIRELSWSPKLTSEEAVRKITRDMLKP